MSKRAAKAKPEMAEWVEAMLAGTGYSAATVREATAGGGNLAAAALADGFAAAAHSLTGRDNDDQGGAR